MFMFGGNQDELVQERASRIKSSIWILWCQDYRARNPLGMGSCAIRRCTSRHHIRFCPANPRTVRARSFLTIVVIKRIGPDESSLGRAHEPFSAVRVITRLANRIIRHDEQNKIL